MQPWQSHGFICRFQVLRGGLFHKSEVRGYLLLKSRCTIIIVDLFFCKVIEEELMYRGFLYKALCKYDEGFAAFVSSVIFGLIHWRGEGMAILTLIHVLYAMAVGFLFCTIFYSGKSLWPCNSYNYGICQYNRRLPKSVHVSLLLKWWKELCVMWTRYC